METFPFYTTDSLCPTFFSAQRVIYSHYYPRKNWYYRLQVSVKPMNGEVPEDHPPCAPTSCASYARKTVQEKFKKESHLEDV